jgi:hypothetical protein
VCVSRSILTIWVLGALVPLGRLEGVASAPLPSLRADQPVTTSLPPFVVRTVHAWALLEQDSVAFPDLVPPGTPVSDAHIERVTVDSHAVRFALAVDVADNAATYPAISTDAGARWQIDGPLFWVAAAQGGSGASRVGGLGSLGAYVWGPGGNAVRVTTDGGRHWWVAGFAWGVYSVSASKGVLRTVAFGGPARDRGYEEAFLYVSHDSGLSWELRGELPNVKIGADVSG